MTYELAKKLKEAGFPQNTLRAEDTFLDDESYSMVVVPSLIQLIEACGEEFYQLRKNIPENNNGKDWDWIAHRRDSRDMFNGSIPEEAVAKLWLELSPKKEVK